MTTDELNTLLDNQDIRFRRVALDDIVMSFPAHSDLFFQAFHTGGILAKELADAAKQWMPFLREGYKEIPYPSESNGKYSLFPHLAESYSEFVRFMRQDLNRLDEASARRTLDALWYHFPGLRGDIRRESVPPEPDEHRQLMVFVTGRCNLHCPYCFSKELQKSSISKTDLSRILSWAERSEVKSLLPCGGEPLLYESFDYLISEADQRGIKVYFATNLTVPLPSAMRDSRSRIIGQLHVHITDDLFRDKRLMFVFRDNLHQCRDRGIDIILRGNICAKGTDSHYEEWFSLANEYGIDALNVAFTIPSHTGSNNFVHFDALQGMVQPLMKILALGRKNNIRVSIAKPLPLCAFPEDVAIDILRHDFNASYCNVYEDHGMHNLSLSNDLHFSPCLGVDEPSVAFSPDIEWNSLRDIFSLSVERLQSRPLFKRCHGCFLYHRRLCQGACLSYKAEGRNGGVPCGS